MIYHELPLVLFHCVIYLHECDCDVLLIHCTAFFRVRFFCHEELIVFQINISRTNDVNSLGKVICE